MSELKVLFDKIRLNEENRNQTYKHKFLYDLVMEDKIITDSEAPDGYYIDGRDVIIFEHFEIDDSKKDKKGSKGKKRSHQDNLCYKKQTEQEKIIKPFYLKFHPIDRNNYNVQQMHDSFHKNFNNHYEKIKQYKQNISSKLGIPIEKLNFKVCFVVEQKTFADAIIDMNIFNISEIYKMICAAVEVDYWILISERKNYIKMDDYHWYEELMSCVLSNNFVSSDGVYETRDIVFKLPSSLCLFTSRNELLLPYNLFIKPENKLYGTISNWIKHIEGNIDNFAFFRIVMNNYDISKLEATSFEFLGWYSCSKEEVFRINAIRIINAINRCYSNFWRQSSALQKIESIIMNLISERRKENNRDWDRKIKEASGNRT